LVRTEFNSKIFKGVAIEFSHVKSIDDMTARLTANRQVKQVWPIRSYSHSADSTFTPIGTDTDDFSIIADRQAAGNATDIFSTHVQTQVDKLWNAGIKGKGVRIGIIDTGVCIPWSQCSWRRQRRPTHLTGPLDRLPTSRFGRLLWTRMPGITRL
jgi:hypothetical protein